MSLLKLIYDVRDGGPERSHEAENAILDYVQELHNTISALEDEVYDLSERLSEYA